MGSTAQALVEQWHETHRGEEDHDDSSCWCCCTTCGVRNPHYDEAQAERIDAGL